MRLLEFSGRHSLQSQMGHDAQVWFVDESHQKARKKAAFLTVSLEITIKWTCHPQVHTQTLTRSRCSFYTHLRSLEIPLGVRFIVVVIGFITPLHHSAALPFAMVDEPLRPLKHGRLRDWGWGKGEEEGGWRKARRLRSLLLHLLHHLLMFSIHLFSHYWRSLHMLLCSALKPSPSATSPLSLSTKKSEWMDCHTL